MGDASAMKKPFDVQTVQAALEQAGWRCLPDAYDDGGFAGSNMDRPALKRLLADIEAGKIDCGVF